MKTFLNMKSSQGRETVDEFEKQEGQSVREYLAYAREMVKEYQIAGMDVYRSSRCCANWK
jgi:hypothetical protein